MKRHTWTVDEVLPGVWVAQLWRRGRLVSGAWRESSSAMLAAWKLTRAFPGATYHTARTCTEAPCRPCRRDETGEPMLRNTGPNRSELRKVLRFRHGRFELERVA